MTLVSLLVTLLLGAVARMEHSLPPPHGCLLAASTVNTRLCCDEESSTGDAKAESAAGYAKDWRKVFAAFNNALSLLLIVIYILGVIILLC